MYHVKDPFKNLPCLKINGNKQRILLLTHTDLDGSGAVIILKAAMPETVEVDVKYCANGIMSKEILNSVTKNDIARKYDLIIACDISCNISDAASINNSANRYKFVLLDHHDTALNLNKFEWACVHPGMVETEQKKLVYDEKMQLCHSCGTSLMYDYLKHNGFISDTETLNCAVDVDTLFYLTTNITLYDTWDFVNVFNKTDISPYDLNVLFYAMGAEIFEESMLSRCKHRHEDSPNSKPPIPPYHRIFDTFIKTILKIEYNKIKKHKEKIAKTLINGEITLDNQVYSVVYCYTNEYLRDAFDVMKDTYPCSDLYAINYGTGVSVCTSNPDIHVGNLLKSIGGGGHAGAGGVKLSTEEQKKYIEAAFKTTITQKYV